MTFESTYMTNTPDPQRVVKMGGVSRRVEKTREDGINRGKKCNNIPRSKIMTPKTFV